MATLIELRTKLRAATRGAYDLQKLRIQSGLRLCAQFRNVIGQEANVKEEELDAEAKQILDELRDDYARITDGIAKRGRSLKKTFTGDGLISDYSEFVLVKQYIELETVETEQFRLLSALLDDFPIFTKFLKGVKGIGPAMAAVIISEIDIHRAQYPTSLFLYSGLDVVPEDNRGRSRRKEHLVKREYKAKDGTIKERDSITFNPFLKSKLVGVLGGSFLRSASPYRKVYDDYKVRLQNREDVKEGWSKMRIHRAAIRYMIKMFLIDLHVTWRGLEGLQVSVPYSEEKLGLEYHSPNGVNIPPDAKGKGLGPRPTETP